MGRSVCELVKVPNGWTRQARSQFVVLMARRFAYIFGIRWTISAGGSENSILAIESPIGEDPFGETFGPWMDTGCIVEAGFELVTFQDPERTRAYLPGAVANSLSAEPLSASIAASEIKRLGR